MSLLSFIRWPLGAAQNTEVPVAPVTKSDWLADGRFAKLLDVDQTETLEQRDLVTARRQLAQKMALVPAGQTVFYGNGSEGYTNQVQVASVSTFYMDRFAVSNRDFLQFVRSGGYRDMKLWPNKIWSKVIQFVDQTGQPGPRHWRKGRPLRQTDDHPVVGVSWYEADAYARWAGKQLPTAAEWQHAGTWSGDPEANSDLARFPWGNGFSPDRANIHAAGIHKTVPVDRYYEGCTPNGIYQLVGNVWEWTSTRFEFQDQYGQGGVQGDLGEIRGGAFDTYFESQASCLFRTGQVLLNRTNNLGFRCCKPVSQFITFE